MIEQLIYKRPILVTWNFIGQQTLFFSSCGPDNLFCTARKPMECFVQMVKNVPCYGIMGGVGVVGWGLQGLLHVNNEGWASVLAWLGFIFPDSLNRLLAKPLFFFCGMRKFILHCFSLFFFISVLGIWQKQTHGTDSWNEKCIGPWIFTACTRWLRKLRALRAFPRGPLGNLAMIESQLANKQMKMRLKISWEKGSARAAKGQKKTTKNGLSLLHEEPQHIMDDGCLSATSRGKGL